MSNMFTNMVLFYAITISLSLIVGLIFNSSSTGKVFNLTNMVLLINLILHTSLIYLIHEI